jgi:hypothetical protein
VRRKRPGNWARNSRFLLQDNAHAQWLFVVKKYVSMHNVTALEPPAMFSRLVTARLFPVSATENRSERATIREHPGSHFKSHASTGKVIEEWFPGMLPNAFTNVGKMCHDSWELR